MSMMTDEWPLAFPAMIKPPGNQLSKPQPTSVWLQDLNEFRGGCSVLGLKLTPAEAFDEPLGLEKKQLRSW